MSGWMERTVGRSGRAAGLLAMLAAGGVGLALAGGCPAEPAPVIGYANTTDPTNRGAVYVGATACGACHADVAATAARHGHELALVDVGGAGVARAGQCEACHGPGSNHLPRPRARDLFVDSSVRTCARCHTDGPDPRVITAQDGFISPLTQYAELLASGGHAAFNCTFCHDPHASTRNDRALGIRNGCMACHGDVNMARHAGAVYRLGDYVEPLTCESCHMPPAAGRDTVGGTLGPLARAGDVSSHIFRIDSGSLDAATMFTLDGTAVRKDAQGRAAVTLDFVCMRCHHGQGSAFEISPAGVLNAAPGLHFEP